MKCPKCGYLLPNDSVFCQYCGTRLDSPSVGIPVRETSSTPELMVPVGSAINERIPEPVSKAVSESNPESMSATPLSEARQEESLFRKAYRSYLSSIPEERRIFEELLGSAELRAAFLEECVRNQKMYADGIRLNFKSTYIDFMDMLQNEYLGIAKLQAQASQMPNEKPVERLAQEPAMTTGQGKQKKYKQRYCKFCGQPIDSTTMKCTGCRKQYFKANFKFLYAILFVLAVLGGIHRNQLLLRCFCDE